MLARAEKTCPDQDALVPVRSCSPLHAFKEDLEENFLRRFCLDDVCAPAGATKFHLIRQFKRRYGLTPRQYAINLRINFAKRLIASGWSLAEAALESGFTIKATLPVLFRPIPASLPAVTGRLQHNTFLKIDPEVSNIVQETARDPRQKEAFGNQ